MRNLLTILFFFICFALNAQLIKFSELPPASTLGGTEIVPGVQSGVNRKISLNQVKVFVWDLTPTIATNDTVSYVLVRRTSDGKVYKRSVSSLFSTNSSLTIHVGNDLNLDVLGDVKLNGVSGNSGEFIGNVDGHLVWAVPPGGGGGGSFQSAVLDVSTNDVGNVGAGEDVLWTYTLPGDTLSTNGQGLYVRVAGSSAINGNSKRIKLKMGDDLMVDPGAGNLTLTWTLDCQVIRTSATTLKSNCQVVTIGAGQTHTVLNDITETLSGDVVFQLTGEAVADNDIIKESATVIRMEGGGGGIGGGGSGDLSTSDLVTSETPTGAVNGSNVTYTLANTPAAFVHVYLNGLLQVEGGGNDYTISGTTITMVAAPLTGSRVRVSYIK